MTFTPGWCIGWFFIPIANLFKPFQAVREIWKASFVSDRNWQDNPSSPLVGLWWALWLVSGALGQMTFRMSMRAESLQELQTSSFIALIADAVSVPMTIVALMMIRGLYSRQETKYEQVGQQPPDESNRRSCRYCGEPVDEKIVDCPMCGEPLDEPNADPQTDNLQW